MITQEHIFLNFDKAGSEWVITAYLSGDQNMIAVVESGVSPHIATGSLITGLPKDVVIQEHKLVGDMNSEEEILEARRPIAELLKPASFLPRTMSIRQASKKGNHGLNYDEGYATFALINSIPQAEAKKIHTLYNTVAYPGLITWRESVVRQVKKYGYTSNCFGRRMPFATPYNYDTWKKAYASIPQSTNVDLVDRAMITVHNERSLKCQLASLRNQSHDSLLYSYDISEDAHLIRMIDFIVSMTQDYMNPTLCYSGRDFHIGTDLKVGFTWGRNDMVEIPLAPLWDTQKDLMVGALEKYEREELKRLVDRLRRIHGEH